MNNQLSAAESIYVYGDERYTQGYLGKSYIYISGKEPMPPLANKKTSFA
jgi:hypothetical protein